MDIFDIIIPDCPPRPNEFLKVILNRNVFYSRIDSIRELLSNFSNDLTKTKHFIILCRITKYVCEDLLFYDRSPDFTTSEADFILNKLIDMINIVMVADNAGELSPAFTILNDIENVLWLKELTLNLQKNLNNF